jgi:PhnB protein
MPKKTSKKAAPRSKAAAKPPLARSTKKKAAARKGPGRAAPGRAKTRASGGRAEKRRVEPVPSAYGSVTPQLVVSPCEEALEFYEKAFGAEVMMRMPAEDGKLMHVEMKIGGSIVMLADELPHRPGHSVRKTPKSAGATTGGIMLYVPDVDATFARALEAGARATMEPQDMFWGDRFGQIEDPFGHSWAMATHLRDVSPAEMADALAAMGATEA